MQSKATSVAQYLTELPAERRAAVEAVRRVIRANLDEDYEEGMQYGMIAYSVPHRVYPAGYHCDPRQPLLFAALAAQKNHLAVHLMCVYGDQALAEWFRKAWAQTGKKLDMGKSCVRFQKAEDLALDVIGEAIRRVPARKYVEHCEAAVRTSKASRAKRTATTKREKGAEQLQLKKKRRSEA
ncbi:MAG TPA: DUF1801 domain-containing protein [Gemmataceae bacterium]|nr:DUF1801 domain-containing protein [Gemmataceae bacterium]